MVVRMREYTECHCIILSRGEVIMFLDICIYIECLGFVPVRFINIERNTPN